MILLDLSSTIYSSFLATHQDSSDIDEGYIRHLILNCIRSYLVKFRGEYGELIICCDGRGSWRKKQFPYYKATRKRKRDADAFDWPKIFSAVSNVVGELKVVFPYKTIQIDELEADDIIAAIARVNQDKPVLILSPDKDFQQLQKYPNVRQFDIRQKVFVVCPDPGMFLKEHIMRGDSSDGIPNFLSDDDTFVTDKKRQKPLLQAKLDPWLTIEPADFCDERMLRNYKRNQLLIDLTNLPDDIIRKVQDELASQAGKKPGDIFGYFMKNRLNELMPAIGEF